jgi:hypothetical protein
MPCKAKSKGNKPTAGRPKLAKPQLMAGTRTTQARVLDPRIRTTSPNLMRFLTSNKILKSRTPNPRKSPNKKHTLGHLAASSEAPGTVPVKETEHIVPTRKKARGELWHSYQLLLPSSATINGLQPAIPSSLLLPLPQTTSPDRMDWKIVRRKGRGV